MARKRNPPFVHCEDKPIGCEMWFKSYEDSEIYSLGLSYDNKQFTIAWEERKEFQKVYKKCGKVFIKWIFI